MQDYSLGVSWLVCSFAECRTCFQVENQLNWRSQQCTIVAVKAVYILCWISNRTASSLSKMNHALLNPGEIRYEVLYPAWGSPVQQHWPTTGTIQKDGARLFSVGHSGSRRGNGHKLEHREILTRYKENICIITVVKQMEEIPREAVGLLLFEVLKLSWTLPCPT